MMRAMSFPTPGRRKPAGAIRWPFVVDRVVLVAVLGVFLYMDVGKLSSYLTHPEYLGLDTRIYLRAA